MKQDCTWNPKKRDALSQLLMDFLTYFPEKESEVNEIVMLSVCPSVSFYNGFLTNCLAVPWLRWLLAGLSRRRYGFAPGSVHVGLVVNKVALGQGYPPSSLVSPVSIIPPWPSKLIYHRERGEQQACWWPQFRDIGSPHRREQQLIGRFSWNSMIMPLKVTSTT
jgi:hypothetical protein